MFNISGLAVVMIAATSVQYAEAQTFEYTVDDVVAYFAPTHNLGDPRSLCVGAPSNCKPVEIPKPFDLHIQFDFNSAEITATARRKLGTFATAADDPRLDGARFFIDGHTDGHGADVLNQNLSERRAEAVVRYLNTLGVDRNRLVPRGFGEGRPLTGNVYDERNRRVEASLAGPQPD